MPNVPELVRGFYDRYPYPRPIDSLNEYQHHWQKSQRRRADYHLFWPGRPYSENHSVLIAGCGTSQAAKHALRWPAAQVTGIDFSATSVRCSEELKRKHKINNLQLYQLPVERVNELGTCFDQIVCTGVLHHLADPDAGLGALRSVLKPDGAMQLMMYAPYGRTGIYILQEFCRRLGITATDENIGDLTAALKALPPGHPLEHLLREAPDFRHEAELADALLHPQDRAYSVPQLLDFLDWGGLTFGRWLRQAPYMVQCGVLARIPQAGRIAQLPVAEQYAAVELFRGTMARHSLIAYRRDSGNAVAPVSLAGDAWLEYVPIRMPDTVCIQEQLPAGAAAVLINRSHTYKDLILVIDSTEKLLFEAVDGSASIREIVEGRLPSLSIEIARGFFDRLWRYDQVVFDTSRSSAGSQ